MTDITATVTDTSTNFTVAVDGSSSPTVSAVGIQGLSANNVGISSLADVDALLPDNGAVLVFKTITNRWTASTTLDAQNMEGGEF
jgi:hypothetical protein